jgi:hypothetical protein
VATSGLFKALLIDVAAIFHLSDAKLAMRWTTPLPSGVSVGFHRACLALRLSAAGVTTQAGRA